MRKEQLLEKILNPDPIVQLYRAEVIRVKEESCTVRLLHNRMEVDGVLYHVPDARKTIGLIVEPKVGSVVLVGRIENDLTALAIVSWGEINGIRLDMQELSASLSDEAMKVRLGGSTVEITKSDTTVECDGAKVRLQGRRVELSSMGVSLQSLMSDLVTILNSLIVLTPVGPSTGLSPTSIAQITTFQTKLNQLLK